MKPCHTINFSIFTQDGCFSSERPCNRVRFHNCVGLRIPQTFHKGSGEEEEQQGDLGERMTGAAKGEGGVQLACCPTNADKRTGLPWIHVNKAVLRRKENSYGETDTS